MTHKCDRQTDGQTDFTIANAVLHYVAWPKSKQLKLYLLFHRVQVLRQQGLECWLTLLRGVAWPLAYRGAYQTLYICDLIINVNITNII